MNIGKQVLDAERPVLGGVTSDFYDAGAPNLLDRWQPLTDWANARLEQSLDATSKVTTSRIAPETQAYDRAGRPISGLNFASQDYLNLSSHPEVLAAAIRAAQDWGVHSAGSAALMGLGVPVVELERRLAGWLGTADATVFSTGWGAGYGSIRTLMRAGGHILIDVLAHACLQEAANCSGAAVHRFPHCSTDGVERRLRRIRADHPDGGILVVTEGVFSMDSDTPDIAALQSLCRDFGATLFVDVAHDLGAMGPTGRGVLEIQGMIGKVDIVMGSFSKTFASNGGFVASSHPALKLALRYACGPQTFTNALSPVQAMIVQKCLDLVQAEEGRELRAAMMRNAEHLRDGLQAEGFAVMGQPSAIVPVLLGDLGKARMMTRDMIAQGCLVNLVEFPAVAKNACRWRLQVMAQHSRSQIGLFVQRAAGIRNAFAG